MDCVSEITFSTMMTESEIIGAMSEYYDFDKDGGSVKKTDDGSYTFYQVTSAPFPPDRFFTISYKCKDATLCRIDKG